MNNQMPFIDLKSQYADLKNQINERINQVLEHGQYILGPEVKELEVVLEDFTGSSNCISVSSGTDALIISLMALGIGKGCEVITTPFTFAATVEAIVLLGATPVLVDVDLLTGNLDPALIEEAITPFTRAIIPVSLWGQPADMDAINAIANKYEEISVIEDAAQSFGAMYKGKRSCNLSTMACTSFFPSKPLGCYGDGGAILTNNPKLAQLCRDLRIHGQASRYQHTRIGIAGRMDTIQCAVLLAKFEKFPKEIERRGQVARLYDRLIDSAKITKMFVKSNCSSVYAQYTIRAKNRDTLQERLDSEGIPTYVHYPIPIHFQDAYKNLVIYTNLKNSEILAAEVISLPMHPYLEDDDVNKVVKSLMKWYEHDPTS